MIRKVLDCERGLAERGLASPDSSPTYQPILSKNIKKLKLRLENKCATLILVEAPHELPIVHRYESPLKTKWEVKKPDAWKELTDLVSAQGKFLPEPPTAFRGGGIIAPSSKDLAPSYAKFLESERPFAVVPVTSEPGGKLTDVVHFPTKKENMRFDANLAAYRQHLGDYVFNHWDAQTNGPAPLPQVTNVSELPDGRVVTTERYRGYLRGIGKGSGALGIHELDTQRISTDELRHIVRALEGTHPTAKDFYAWLAAEGRTLPAESLLHPDNPQSALRGKEWWTKRIDELGGKIKFMEKDFKAIDPNFSPKEALTTMITNNLDLDAEPVVVHGTLYPDNIQLARDRDGRTSGMTVMGGDRSHIGVRGEMVDWLITASAESPAHQQAIIEEFLTLHPDEKDKQGLAMHVLYRSIMEASWFQKSKPEAYGNLIKLSYDIMNGNGV